MGMKEKKNSKRKITKRIKKPQTEKHPSTRIYSPKHGRKRRGEQRKEGEQEATQKRRGQGRDIEGRRKKRKKTDDDEKQYNEKEQQEKSNNHEG